LLAAGHGVYTLSLAPEGTQDLVLGRTATAAALGTAHFEMAMGPIAFEGKRGLIHRAWSERATRGIGTPARASIIWSGDSGSVGVGHVYLKPVWVELARAGRPEAAVGAHLAANKIAVSATFLSRRLAEDVAQIPKRGCSRSLGCSMRGTPGAICISS
jgi:hypothetical protein